MPASEANIETRRNRANWIPLRTIVALRWIAIFGQLLAITVSKRVFGLELDLGLSFLVIGASIVTNLVAAFVFPENKRLSEFEAFVLFAFDILQLSALLLLTGGLNNPFALLLIAPFMISAVTLKRGTTVSLGALVITIVTILAIWHVPLQLADGSVLKMPDLFIFGFWASIVIGVLFLGVYASRVAAEVNAMDDALTALQLALAREQKLTDLGGVVAAAAHELGTPLATIKLTSAELIEDLSDRPELQEDAILITEQADRCRDILRSMGRAGKDDLHVKIVPIEAVVEEAADPHANRGKVIHYSIGEPQWTEPQPNIRRQPEIIHGLRNLVQNAVDFAQTSVWVEITWSDLHIVVRITDDGPGFSPSVIGRIGDPFVRKTSRPLGSGKRPNYEGMGLGLFIAKTLLERTGAEMSFANGREAGDESRPGHRDGAIVEARWRKVDLARDIPREALGENQLIG